MVAVSAVTADLSHCQSPDGSTATVRIMLFIMDIKDAQIEIVKTQNVTKIEKAFIELRLCCILNCGC